MNENNAKVDNKDLQVFVDYSSAMYDKGFKDGLKYTLLGMAAGAGFLFVMDCIAEFKKGTDK